MKNSIKIGIYEFTLKNFKQISGHDDTVPFEGTLYVNDKRVARAYNDGWGGNAVITPISEEVVRKIEKYLIGRKYEGFEVSINDIADYLACYKADYIEATKSMKNYLVFEYPNGNGYMKISVASIKNGKRREVTPLGEVLSTKGGFGVIDKIIKKYESQGYVCINTNIPF